MEDCIFCKIIAGDIPSEKVFENDEMVSFKDINPVARHHLLIVPKKHIPTMNDLNEDHSDDALVGRMLLTARDLAREMGLKSHKLQFNVGEGAGQTVFHIHLHLISNG